MNVSDEIIYIYIKKRNIKVCAHLYQKMAKRGTDTKYTEFVFVVVHDIESTFIFFFAFQWVSILVIKVNEM